MKSLNQCELKGGGGGMGGVEITNSAQKYMFYGGFGAVFSVLAYGPHARLGCPCHRALQLMKPIELQGASAQDHSSLSPVMKKAFTTHLQSNSYVPLQQHYLIDFFFPFAAKTQRER